MPFGPVVAPWQLGPVSSLGRTAAVALAALSVDSIWLWQVSPSALLTLALVVGPLVVAVRVARGFPGALLAAMVTSGITGALVAAQLAFGSPASVSSRNALIVAAALAVSAFAAAVAAWLEQRRWNKPAVIELTRSTNRDPFARARSR
jgi:hypothetical protein